MIPPLLVWCGLFLYLMTVDKRVRLAEERIKARDGMPPVTPYPR